MTSRTLAIDPLIGSQTHPAKAPTHRATAPLGKSHLNILRVESSGRGILDVPDDAPELDYAPSSLPADWRQTPPPPECQAIGREWAGRGEELLLRVPSVLVPEESNVLVNPTHPAAAGVRLIGSRPFSCDVRLLTWNDPVTSGDRDSTKGI
ncbi:RES family NAD+ phosphorylase [Candidatus Palauibacter sp.]|uniref:RES family NAD+ phosphorylase n=1 Tax=Candidatus Palauibacter sp. TaxID=3101350 RepID=UPI003D0D937B